LLKSKDEAREKIIELRAYLKTQFGYEIKVVHGDNASELNPLMAWLRDQGIHWEPAPTYTPQLNGVAEIKNRHLMEPVVAILIECQLPKYLWGLLTLAVNYINNRMPHSKIGMTPYEALHGYLPKIDHWRALGCQCWAWVPKQLRGKLDSHTVECRMVGYTSDGLYRLYCLENKRVITSRNVIFKEVPTEALPPASIQGSESLTDMSPDVTQNQWQEIQRRHVPGNMISPTNTVRPSTVRPSLPTDSTIHNDALEGVYQEDWFKEYKATGVLPPLDVIGSSTPISHAEPTIQQDVGNQPPMESSSSEPPSKPPSETPALRRTTREGKPSQRYLESLQGKSAKLGMADPELQSTYKNEVSELIAANAASIENPHPPDDRVPTTVSAAMKDPQWKEAIHIEMQRQIRRGTWRTVPYIKGTRLLPLKWVFKIKSDGRYKARLVVKGFKQRFGTDFFEVYASVAKPMSFKILIALSAKFGWKIHHYDFITAFLNSDLKESIYIDLPDGYKEPGMMGQLQRTLYGLKQSPREWYQTIHNFLVAAGFYRTHADHSVYVRGDVIILLYVDDMLLFSPTDESIQVFKQHLEGHFDITDGGEASCFLGIEITRSDDGSISLSQSRYIRQLLKRFGMEQCNKAAVPMDDRARLEPHTGKATADDILWYKSIVGSLIWLVVGTRVDIAYAVSILSRSMTNPGPQHKTAAQRVLRWLAGTINLSVRYTKGGGGLVGYTDADWAGLQSEDCKSTSGYVFKLSGGPVSWCSKKQTSVALSSTESEYIAQALAVQEATWIQLFISELGALQLHPTPLHLRQDVMEKPTIIHADNQGAIAMSKTQSTMPVLSI
jgi:hypothetical protein